MSAKESIEKLAAKVAEAALADGVDLEQRIEALKVLNAHYTILARHKGSVEDGGGESSFADFQQQLEEAQEETANGGATSVRSRSRGRRPS